MLETSGLWLVHSVSMDHQKGQQAPQQPQCRQKQHQQRARHVNVKATIAAKREVSYVQLALDLRRARIQV